MLLSEKTLFERLKSERVRINEEFATWGNVKTQRSPLRRSPDGYLSFRAYGASVSVARLVCWLTHGDPQFPDARADHRNFVTDDNSPENLRWLTRSQNGLHQKNDTLETKYPREYNQTLRPMREQAGVSLRAVAREMGISSAYLVDIELCRRGLSQRIERRYKRALARLSKPNVGVGR